VTAPTKTTTQMFQELAGTLACFIDGIPDPCLVIDQKGAIVFANAKAERMFEHSRERLIATSVEALISERSRDCYSRLKANVFHSAFCQERCEGKRMYALRGDGTEFPAEIFLSPLPLQSGLVAVLNIRDCTSLTQVERELDRVHGALHELEQQRRLLFDAIPLPTWVSDRETGAFLAVNESAIRHYGFTLSEFRVMTTREICTNERDPQTEAGAPPEGAQGKQVLEHRKKDGSVIQVEMTTSDIHFDGRGARLVLIQDITRQNRNQNDLRQSEERFAKAFRSSPVAITISTLAEGRYIDVNDAFLKIMGYPREAVIGRSVRELGVWVEAGERAAMVEELSAVGSATVWSARFRTKSGEVRLTNIFAERVELDGVPCVLGITQDITEAHRLEEQLRQSQKMQAVGRLASGVAHDFSNMLSVILGYSELLAERNPTSSSAKSVEEIRKAAERAASLTRQLLAFSRQQAFQPKTIRMNDAAESATKMLLPLLGEDIEFLVKLDPAAGVVRADAIQIEQVLLNLAINARDAMPRGGRLLIETGNIDLDATFSGAAGLRPGPYVVLSVSDTGCGMDVATLAHIFEPFFTTKVAGKGTGLGLSIVYGCVKQNGGHIWVTSQPGKGACFKVYLPRVEEETPPRRDPTSTDVKGGCETILVVEDDDSLRLLTAKVLEANGYVTLQAAGGKQAIEVARRYSGPIDLLLTDVVMPGLGGGSLAAVITAFRPQLKVLYISGYPNELIAYHGAIETSVALLEKPFTTHDLLSQVRSVLTEPV
jgi:two-component system cell cycle sensor histidine kinase/response regulator CckA